MNIEKKSNRRGLTLSPQADLLNLPVLRPANLESTAMGAVFMVGLGVGLWKDTRALAAAWKPDRRFDPATDRSYTHPLRANWEAAIHTL